MYQTKLQVAVAGNLLVCNIEPCCRARLYCLFYVFYCVLSKINDDDDDDDDE